MCNNYISSIKKLAEALVVETRTGYKNAAVFGGFSTFAISLLNKLHSDLKGQLSSDIFKQLVMVVSQLELYQEHTGREREKIAREIDNLITSLPEKLNRCDDQTLQDKTLQDKTSPDKTSQDKISRDKTSPDKNSSEPRQALTKSSPAGLQFLKNVGPRRVRLLNRLGINNIEDLLYHFPRRYEDRSVLKRFHQLTDGETETVFGRVVASQEIKPRKKLNITKLALHDGVSVGYAVWFNQPYIKKQVPQGSEILVTGKVERKFGSIQITVTDFEICDNDEPIHTGRIVPVYPATEGLPPKVLRSIIRHTLEEYGSIREEFLPGFLVQKYGLLPLGEALLKIHFPEKMSDIEEARKRLVFEELFLLQIGVGLMKVSDLEEQGIKHKPEGPLSKQFMESLPFGLTDAQLRVLDEIFGDMERDKPMNRLVQGDVGSGKTVIAAASLVKTVENGFQGVMMAPTEILAAQHYEGLSELLNPLGINVALLTGSLSKNEKARINDDIKTGFIDIVVGTHAVIQDEVLFQNLGLAVTDEQHRFGVRQRAKLKEKGTNPDILVMTATPIPRTLALTVYGDLDISVIDQLPPGRQVIKTYWVNHQMKERVFKFIRDQVAAGRQVYYVCPLVEESEKVDVTAAVEMADYLQMQVFPDLNIGLMHGRLRQDEKDLVMKEFKKGSIDILVATTVVEVGVNVPNSTLMVIEDADRFGLAQLHQLRGRVGRGSHQSYCILVASPGTDEGKARMNIMQATSDGFVIAEEDLKIRGPGDFFGTRQSGLPDLKIADIIKDVKILQVARDEAFRLLSKSPALAEPELLRLKDKVIAKFRDTGSYIKIS